MIHDQANSAFMSYEEKQKMDAAINDSFKFIDTKEVAKTVGAEIERSPSMRKTLKELSSGLLRACIHQYAIDKAKKFNAKFVFEVSKNKQKYAKLKERLRNR